MAEKTITGTGASLVKIGSSSGHTIIDKSGLLRRLHYFDGKFLRAPDLLLEQQALLNQVRIANRAGGAGVVHGYDCLLSGGELSIGTGMAIDNAGRALMLHEDIRVGIAELIEKSRAALAVEQRVAVVEKADTGGFDDCVLHTEEPPLGVAESSDLYLITLHHAEAYCGEEDVYGKLCSEACTTSTERSYIIEGIEVRATPLELTVPLKQSQAVALGEAHLRSRVASAYFEQERRQVAAQISASGLTSSLWCLGAAAATGNGVPIAVLGRRGGTTLFLDAWTARRERMEVPPRHYWAYRMMMRPWKVFLAQILQFQCQLRACLTATDPEAPCKKLVDFDPCADTRKVAGKAAEGMRLLLDRMGAVAGRLAEFDESVLAAADFDFAKDLSQLERNYQKLVDVSRIAVPDRLMINCGIVEVPSAGYLPVNANSTVSVNEQVTRMFGPGVDLRFCVVRPDFVAHALEEAQHMERICLLQGLEDAAKKPRVDVLVPNGEIQQLEVESRGTGYRANIQLRGELFALGWPRKVLSRLSALRGNETVEAAEFSSVISYAATVSRQLPEVSGAARGERLTSGGFSFYCAAQSGRQAALQTATLAAARRAADSVLNLLGEGDTAERLSSGLRINTNIDALAGSTLVPGTALWLDLKTERNPFELATGESTDVRGKCTVVVSRTINNVNQLTVEERRISGQLHITQGAAQKTDTKLVGRLIADGTWQQVTLADGERSERSEPVELDEKVIISRAALAGLPPSISIAIVNPSFFAGLDNVQLLFERSWVSVTESRARVLLRYQSKYTSSGAEKFVAGIATNLAAAEGSEEFVFAEASLVEDSAVLKPGNEFHSASLNALSAIGKATDNNGFADRAGKLLFPPPQKLPEELRILARESWVLFHRRREKTCEQITVPEVLVRERQYRIYHIHLPVEIDVDKLAEELAADADGVIAGFKPKAVTTVAFAPGLAAVETSHGDVRSDWQAAVQVDADTHIGVIASEGEVIDDGEALADARLQRLTDLLAPVSEPADDLELLSINRVPASLAAGEVDGVIVYFTKAVATECHMVYRLLTSNPDEMGKKWEEYKSEDTSVSLTHFIRQEGGEVLSSSPRFESGSETFYGTGTAAELDASWDLLGDGPVSRVITMGVEDTEEQEQITSKQALRIARVLDNSVDESRVSYEVAPSRLFRACPKATILIAETQCHDVYFITSQTDNPSAILMRLQELAKNGKITAEMLQNGDGENAFSHLQPLDFYLDSDQLEKVSVEQFRQKWLSALGGGSPSGFTGYYLTLTDKGHMEEELVKQQAEKINNLMEVERGMLLTAVNGSDLGDEVVEFPVQCPALTVVLFPIKPLRLAEAIESVALVRGSETGDSTEPVLSMELANIVRFDSNNELIRDELFAAAIERLDSSDTKIKTLEQISMDGTAGEKDEARAKALLKVLKEEGLANRNAKVVVREANAKEKVEIVRSSFVLDRGIVLK
ncbi:hypothetical protein [Microbulbifer rhizosphaerae]|uniref:Uncharacterized protein n=1 Tax=Microbulbifer rhizosphaerae TaxID=1562603 RepID=A0A7W4WF72_9GAMM|nr:hypothetical protein [Microbulbifer rhizosphaerae]MBB3063120.1 hypothetical protein [Microbulbifer rhizosphaerae]